MRIKCMNLPKNLIRRLQIYHLFELRNPPNSNYFKSSLFTVKKMILQQIEKYMSQHSNPVVACSFGKDSLVVLHMVRQINPDIPVIFNNTLSEFPDTLLFKRQLQEKWTLNLVEAKPLDGWNFWKIVDR